MRKRMKHFATLCFAALLCAGVMMGKPAVVHAEEDVYDFSTHEQPGGYVLMDNTHGYECNVELFVLTQNNLNYNSYKIPYHFSCYSHLPEGEKHQTFTYTTYTPNGDEITDLGSDTVYSYNWTMKDGDYTFCYPDGLNNIYTLTRTFESPMIDDGFYTFEDLRDGNNEIVTIEDGDHVRLYALCGEYQWAKENVDAFIIWAKEYEQNFHVDDGSGDDPLSQDKKEEAETVTEGISEPDENAVSDMSSDTIVEEEVMLSNDETQTEEMLQPTPEDESGSSVGTGGALIAIIAIFSLCVIGLIVFAMIKLLKKK